MENFLQAVALAILGAVLALVVGNRTKEMGILLTIACTTLIAILSFAFLEPIVDFLVELRLLGELQKDHVSILLRSAGMCLVMEFACSICEDAGQSALAKIVRVCGNAALVYIALPLLQTVIQLLRELLGG